MVCVCVFLLGLKRRWYSTSRAEPWLLLFFFRLFVFFSSFFVQAFLLGIVYVMFALWRLIDIVQDDLGGNTIAAEFMLFMKTRQVRSYTAPGFSSGVCQVGVRARKGSK